MKLLIVLFCECCCMLKSALSVWHNWTTIESWPMSITATLVHPTCFKLLSLGLLTLIPLKNVKKNSKNCLLLCSFHSPNTGWMISKSRLRQKIPDVAYSPKISKKSVYARGFGGTYEAWMITIIKKIRLTGTWV